MKKIIFRLPTSKKSKYIAAQLLLAAETNMKSAERLRELDGAYTEQSVMLIKSACKLWNQAAIRLGFRNLADMEEYKERYGISKMFGKRA